MAQSNEDQSVARTRVSDEQLQLALSDERYLKRQLKCALGEAACDPVGRRLKSTFAPQISNFRYSASKVPHAEAIRLGTKNSLQR